MLLGCTPAMADTYVMFADYTCHLPPASFGDIFKTFAENARANGFPPPWVDYTSGESRGMTVIHYTRPNTGSPAEILFFASQEGCEAARQVLISKFGR
jgi:hypothetical protein